MNYDLNQDQQILKDAAHNFLQKECPTTFVRQMLEDEKGYTPTMWKKMAELGWMGILFPEEYGGYGGSFMDMAVLLYETGYVCLPGPFFASVVMGGLTVLEGGNEKQKKDLLPGIAGGERIVTLAWTEESGSYSLDHISTGAELRGDSYILNGTKLFVPYAHVSDTMICVARTAPASSKPGEGLSLFLVDGKSKGVSVQVLKTLAGDKQGEVILNQVRIPKDNLLGNLNQGGIVLHKILLPAAVAKCAEMSGGGQRVLELTLDHAKQRVQFGKPIGAFQAIQHFCANILTYLDTSRFMTYQAAWKISEGRNYEKEAVMAKAWVSDSYRRLVALAHQVLGGMGFMEEHDLHLYFKQAKAAELAFGDADFHRELLAQQMGW
jgi:alkylation response protein AidB-like acyl-CoA dehydrogenase